uniref:hypothetical protein n=1 Tax=Algoriphagus sp. TaxID=1872435 RepID=UPI0040475C27
IPFPLSLAPHPPLKNTLPPFWECKDRKKNPFDKNKSRFYTGIAQVLEPEQEKFTEKMPCKLEFTGHQLI